MNFLLVKLSQNLLGTASSPYTRFNNLTAISWRICEMYWRRTSASCRVAGGSKAWFNGKLASPGMAKLLSSARFRTAFQGSSQLCCLAVIIFRVPPMLYKDPTHLLSISPGHACLDLAQRLAHKQNAVNQHAVSRALDLKVAEEGVGAEEGEDFVDGVVRLVRGINGELGDVGGERGQRHGGSACPRAERQQGKIAWSVSIRAFERALSLAERRSGRRLELEGACGELRGVRRTYYVLVGLIEEDGVIGLNSALATAHRSPRTRLTGILMVLGRRFRVRGSSGDDDAARA